MTNENRRGAPKVELKSNDMIFPAWGAARDDVWSKISLLVGIRAGIQENRLLVG